MAKRMIIWAATVAGVSCLAGCGGEAKRSVPSDPEPHGTRTAPNWGDEPRQSIFGPNGITLFGGDSGKSAAEPYGIGVNAFLWRASLDTVAFMPLASADPFGGVIITDWYSPPESPAERFKMSVFIMDRTLRADGIRVAVFRQVQA